MSLKRLTILMLLVAVLLKTFSYFAEMNESPLTATAQESGAGVETPKAPLQDREGTPIYLTPQPMTPSPAATDGPSPTPMKVADHK